MVLAAQTWADSGPERLRLNRVWSLSTGVSAAAGAALAGAAVAYEVGLRDVLNLVPVMIGTGLLLVLVSFLTPSATAFFRRSAAAMGVLGTSALVALPGLILVLWQPLRPLQENLREHSANTRLENIGAEEAELVRFWTVAIVLLLLVAAVTWAAGQRESWPVGPWSRRVRNGLKLTPVPLLASTIFIALLAPQLPVFVTVAA